MRIGVVAPAGRIDEVVAARAMAFAAIAYPSVDLIFHPQCYRTDGGHFAGPDSARAAAFLEYANDPTIDALWFARGGYGSNRILADVIPNLGAAAATKSYAGFSDMGFILGALYARRIGKPVHAPMVSSINNSHGGDAVIARTLSWLVDKDRRWLEPSLGKQPTVAFNLSILNNLLGTQWMPDLTDHVLMIEEVSEALYRVDRMLFQMANATQLKGIAGVRLGAISDVTPNTPEFAETPQQMIERWCKDMKVPFLGPADIGHVRTNKVVPFGLV